MLSHQQGQGSPIVLQLDKDSVQVPCTVCPRGKHTVFHCAVLGPKSLIVLDPVLPEVFINRDVFDTSLTLEDIRETIAFACHILPEKLVLRSKFFEPLNDDIKLQELAQMEPVETRFPRVIYALTNQLAAEVDHELAFNANLVSSQESIMRALVLLPQCLKDLPNIPGSAVKVTLSPTIKRAKAALHHAVSEIINALPEGIQRPEEVRNLIGSIRTKIDQLGRSPVSRIQLKSSAEPWVPRNVQPPPKVSPYPSQYTDNSSFNTFPVAPPELSRDNVIVQAEIPSRSIFLDYPPDHHISVKSHHDLIKSLMENAGFEADFEYNQLLIDPWSLWKTSVHPVYNMKSKRRRLMIEVARYQLATISSVYAKVTAEYIMLLMIIQDTIFIQGDDPFTQKQWSELCQLFRLYAPEEINFNLRRIAMLNLIALTRPGEVPPLNKGKSMGFFRGLALLTISFGLDSFSKICIEAALVVLQKRRLISTKRSVYDMLVQARDIRATGFQPDFRSSYSNFLLKNVTLCTCIPNMFLDFLNIWIKATGTSKGIIISAMRSAQAQCNSFYCLQALHSISFRLIDQELRCFMDLYARFIKLKGTSTPKEIAHADSLLQIITPYTSSP